MSAPRPAPSGARPIVAIDGPSGVGKSTVARRLAERLGIPYLDTGAMYRALGLRVVERGVDPADRAAVAALAEQARVSLEPAGDGSLRVLLDGAAVEARIRTPEVARVTSAISAYPEVRRRMVTLQRRSAEAAGGVVEGRDIGTRVFPETPFKLFLDARPAVRIERRHRQLREAGKEVGRAEVEQEVEERDARDRGRADSPLACDDSYHYLDASDLTADEVLEALLAVVAPAAGRPVASGD